MSVLYVIAEQLIYTRRMAQPSLRTDSRYVPQTDSPKGTARTVFLKMAAHFSGCGYDTTHAIRGFEQMAKYTRSMTIMAAINVVFNTQRVFAPNKPFEMKDVLEIEPYLACDEEIAAFCFSSLSNMFVDPAQVRSLLRYSRESQTLTFRCQAKPVIGFVRQMCYYPPSESDINKVRI